MTDRRPGPWIAGMLLIALAALASALVLLWYSTDLEVQVYEFYSTQTAPVSDDVYRRWDDLSQTAYTLQALFAPLLTGAMAAVFGTLGVLALRWERPVPVQDDAEAATVAS